jgi:hypothetical protein
MPRAMVGLLAAAGAIMSALVGLTHGHFVAIEIAAAGAATGLAAYMPLLDAEKNSNCVIKRLTTAVIIRLLYVATPPSDGFCQEWA